MYEPITLPGVAAMVPVARHYVRGLLEGAPRAGEVETVVSEMATNAVRHSVSSAPGGTFTVRLSVEPKRVRVEVLDAGPMSRAGDDTRDPDESGYGLVVAGMLADRFSHDFTAAGTCAWAEFDWQESDESHG